MKKVLVLMLVLVMAALAPASIATVSFQIAPQDVKDNYAPSDIITINLVDTGQVTGMMIDAISDGGKGGVASEPQTFNAGLGSTFPGSLNADGQLVEWMAGYVIVIPVVPVTGILYSFEYHVPAAPPSTARRAGLQ